jgi:hypothetical protein
MTRLTLVLALVAVVLGSVAAPARAADAPATTFVARPADGSPTAPQGGWFLFADAQPGAELAGQMALRNDGDGPLSLRLAAVDATTAQRGGVEYGLPDPPPDEVGAWIDLSRDAITLPRGGSVEIPFTVRVPADAAPGDHLGGIAVWAPDEADAGSGESGFAPGVVVETRQVVAVQLGLPGAAPQSLEVQDARAVARPDGPYIEVVIANTGRRLAKATGTLTVDGEVLAEGFAVDTIVPGTSVAFPIRWPGADLDAPHDIEVTLRYDGEAASWTGALRADDAVRAALEDWDAPDGGLPGFRALPWMLGVAGAAILIVGSLLLARPWRRRQVDSARSS